MPTSQDGVLTATFHTDQNLVQLAVYGTGWVGVASVSLTRTATGVGTVPIRSVTMRPVVGGILLWSDNEAPMDTSVTYVATGFDQWGTALGTSTVTVDTSGAPWGLWVKAPGRADLNCQVTLTDGGDMGRAAVGGSYDVPGFGRIAESAGLAMVSTTIGVAVSDAASLSALLGVLNEAPGQIVLLQTGQPEELPSSYYRVVSYTLANPAGVRSDLQAYRTASIQLEQVVMPAGGSTGFFGVSHDSIAAAYASHQAIADAVPMHLVLAQGGWF